jgi:hypothetical protein
MGERDRILSYWYVAFFFFEGLICLGGKLYDGEWKDGEWHGWGTWFNVIGDVKFRGCFEGNSPVRARSKSPIKFTNYQSGSPKKIAYDGWELSSKYQKEKATKIESNDEIIETLPKNEYLIPEPKTLGKTPSRERAKKSKSSSRRGSGRNLPTFDTNLDDKRPWNYSTKPGRNYFNSREFTGEDSPQDDENQYFQHQQSQGRKGNLNSPININQRFHT